MNELEQKFHKAMMRIYEDAKRDCHYNATYFIQMLGEKGALATARFLIATEIPSIGFTRLWECKRLDLTVEAVMLNPVFKSLFTEDERKLAGERLQQYGYVFPE